LKELKKDVWQVLIDRMELRRILSVKRNEELRRQIETGEDLPDIDEAQILAMLEGTLANTGAFIEEAVQEVFEYLRPRHSHYKTNTEFEIGKRVILFALETKWGAAFAWTIIANCTSVPSTTCSTRWIATEPSKHIVVRSLTPSRR